MSDPIPSLLAEPIRTPRGMHLAADGSDPYETFAAYFYGLEMEMAKRYFDPELFTETYLAVDVMLEAWQVPPSQMLKLIQAHQAYQVADMPAWYSATALVCIEKSRTVLRATITPTLQAGRQAALWMQIATHFSGLALTVISGAEDVFVEKVFSARQRKAINNRWDKHKDEVTAQSVVTEIMAKHRKRGDMTLKEFIEAASVGSIDGLAIAVEDERYILDSDAIPGEDLPRRSYSCLKTWWGHADDLGLHTGM